MRIQIKTRNTDRGADVFIKPAKGDARWIMLRWSSEQGAVSGFTGERPDGRVPSVHPLKVSGRDFTREDLDVLAKWAFAVSADLKLTANKNIELANKTDTLEVWDAFLSGKDTAGARTGSATTPADHPDYIAISMAEKTRLRTRNMILNSAADGDARPSRRALEIGSLLSGFQGHGIYQFVRQVFPDMQAPPDIDIDRARVALSAVERPTPKAVNWYAQGGDERLQAASSFPVLAEMIAEHPALSRAVDQREPLQPLLTELTGLSKGALKRLSKLTAGLPVGKLFEAEEPVHGQDALGVDRDRRISLSGEIRLSTALHYLAQLPPDRVPQDNESWMHFHDVLAACAIPLENSLRVPVEKTLKACNGDWKAFHAQLARAADFAAEDFDRRAMALCIIDAIEAIEDFSNTAILPLALSSIESVEEDEPQPLGEYIQAGMAAGSTIVVGNAKNIAVSLLEMARRYASRIPALNEATISGSARQASSLEKKFAIYDEDNFPALTDDYASDNGLVLRNLTCRDHYKRESTRLSHCVGRSSTYFDRAYRGTGFICSIQNEAGTESYSTVELTMNDYGNVREALGSIRIMQHRAKGNSPPTKECEKVLHEWLVGLKKGTIGNHMEQILEWRQHIARNGVQKGNVISWNSILGMEWSDHQARQEAWNEWRYIIGGAFKKADVPDALFRERAVRQIVSDMNPRAAELLVARSRKPDTSIAKSSENEPTPEM